jgi:hypothetical protein
VTIITRKRLFSDSDPETPAIITSISIKKPVKNMINKVINIDIIRNDQKCFADAPKNSEDKNPPSLFPTELKRPPVKKAFMANAVKQIKTKPTDRYEVSDLSTGPRSVKAMISKPSARSSAIMLDPNAEFKEFLNGRTRPAIRTRKANQITRMAFHDFNDRYRPDLIDPNIIIKVSLTIRLCLQRTG